LLVAAGQTAGRNADIRSADAERRKSLVGTIARLVAIEDEAKPSVPAKHGEIDVVQARHVQEQAKCLPVFGQIGDAGVEGLAGRADLNRAPLDLDVARGFGRSADDETRKLGATCADET